MYQTTVVQSKPTFQKYVTGVSILIILLFAQPALMELYIKYFNIKLSANTILVSRLTFWFVLLLIWLYAQKIEKHKLLIWKEKQHKLPFYIASIILLFIINLVVVTTLQLTLTFFHLNLKSELIMKMINVFRENKLLAIFVALTAGVTEELIFRGYLQSRLALIFKNPVVAILISSFIFGALHFGFGTIINAVAPFLIGLIYAIYYHKYRNIKILILSHFLWDVLVIFLSINRY